MSGKGKFTKKAQAKGKFQAKGGSNIASHSIKKSVNDYNQLRQHRCSYLQPI
jgi:hypothetical protein